MTLELGGKSPMLVFDSADVEEAAAWTAMGIWFNSGQDCCASSRVSGARERSPVVVLVLSGGVLLTHVQVYVQEGIYDKFLAALKKKAETVAIGQVSGVPSPSSLAYCFVANARLSPDY